MDTYIYGQSLKIEINCVTPKRVKEKWFNKEGGNNFNNFEKKEIRINRTNKKQKINFKVKGNSRCKDVHSILLNGISTAGNQ